MISCARLLKLRCLAGRLYLNEVSVDVFWRNRLGLNLNGINFRPLKYRHINESRTLYWAVRFFWLPLLVGYNSFLFIRSLFLGWHDISCLLDRPVWLESSIKSEHLRIASGLSGLKVVDIRRGEYLLFLSRIERCFIFFAAIYIISFRSSSLSAPNKVQLIDFYYVLCFLEFISKIDGKVVELHICNHYDRWAMAAFEGFKNGVIIWQHGVLDGNLNLPVKLKNVRSVHSLNSGESKLWLRYLKDVNVKFIVQDKNFMLTAVGIDIDLLVISHPAFVSEEIGFLQYLTDHTKACVAYKPHPAYDYSKVISRFGFKDVYLVPPEEYPATALAITKGSTLGHEYETVGVSVIWWSGESFVELAELIKEKLPV